MDAISAAHMGLRFFQSDSDINLSIKHGRCTLEYNLGFGVTSGALSDVEFSVGVLTNLISQAPHKVEPDLRVWYPNASDYDLSFLVTKPCAGSGNVGVVEFDARCLNSPMPLADLTLATILARFFDAFSADHLVELSMAEMTEALLQASIGAGMLSQLEIASLLGLNVRTLQRALEQEHTTFRRVLERTRRTFAMQNLGKGESIKNTAFELGYEHL